MVDARRQAYLEAMGIDVWVARPPGPEPGKLVVIPGEGSTLLVVARADDREQLLVQDVARALGATPAWAWPDPEGRAESPGLEDAVRDGLFTQVIVFGEDAAEGLFEDAAPRVIASAAVSVVAGIDELATRGLAKKALWQTISRAFAAPRSP